MTLNALKVFRRCSVQQFVISKLINGTGALIKDAVHISISLVKLASEMQEWLKQVQQHGLEVPPLIDMKHVVSALR